MFRPNWGRLTLYIGAVALIYALSSQIKWMGALVVPSIVLAVFMLAADILESSGKKVESLMIRVAGSAATLAFLPPFEWRTPAALIILGVGTVLLAPHLEKNQRVIRGTGLLLLFYGLSQVNVLQTVGNTFLYAGMALFIGYTIAELGQRGRSWADVIERNLVGIGILGGILGLYSSVRGGLSENYPGLVFYGEWLVLVLGVIVAGSMVHSYVGERDPEKYLLSQWRRHESETIEKLGPELAKAREAVEDFVVRGKKGPLITFIAYYGARLFDDRTRFESLISRIADYESRKTSILTPIWIKHAYERRELERRMKIVKEVFDELRTMMG
ncbi:hypothetical protein E3E32_08715 [Thermococcus sp. GR6]|nr:hypothetical protein [Thermococcus sp. GR6]NJE43282.1 hypothetical protein [Thermococcus sp. GR6]